MSGAEIRKSMMVRRQAAGSVFSVRSIKARRSPTGAHEEKIHLVD